MLRLHNVTDWNSDKKCVVTALCAVSGRPCNEVEAALKTEAASQNVELNDLRSISPKVWLKALPRLGLHAKSVQQDMDWPLDRFMDLWAATGLQLAMCVPDNPTTDGEDTHVFAFDGKKFVDTYTHGQIRTFEKLPDDYPSFNVKYVIELSESSDPSVQSDSER